jgi:hypothetical protein
MCGRPEILVSQDLAQVSVLLHTTDPASRVHAEITLYLRPADGVFWFEPGWLM